MPIPSSFPEQERCLKAASAALLSKLGPATLISHSRAGIFGWSWADPKGPLFGVIASSLSANIPRPSQISPPADVEKPLSTKIIPPISEDYFDYIVHKEPARQILKSWKIPILIETGEASYHVVFDHCTFDFLKQAVCETVGHTKFSDLENWWEWEFAVFEEE
jgi:hypothetical protein